MQDYLDPKLIKRLLRPIERPGVINNEMGWEIVRRSQQFANRLPLLSHLTQKRNRNIGIRGEEIPIVYARSQPLETSATKSISAELSESPSSQTTVVQAKFVPGSYRANRLVKNNNNLAGETPKPPDFLAANPSSQTTVIQAKSVLGSEPANRLVEKTNSLSGDTLIPPEFSATKPREENFYESQRIVVSPINIRGNQTTNPVGWVEATKPNTNSQTTNPVFKATTPNANSQTINPVFEERTPDKTNVLGGANSGGFAITQPNLQSIHNAKPIVRGRSQPLPVDLSGLKTPLVFATPRANAASVQAESEALNSGIAGISKTGAIDRNTGLSKLVSANIQSDGESNVQQPNRQNSPNSQTPIDVEALTDKIERKLMQRLIIESERRGRKTWS